MRITYVENSRELESGDVFEIPEWGVGYSSKIIEIRDWCTAQFGDRDGLKPRWKFGIDQTPIFFWFANEQDGFSFRMRWC